MGNDGGSIPTRRELVKEAARNQTSSEKKESRQEQQEYNWTTDPISQKPLVQPVISDCFGKLYNKETILEYLVDGRRKEDAESISERAINSLKDVIDVKFEVAVDDQARTNGKASREIWKCPVTGDRLGPGSKAVYLVPCGHAFSGAAIKEVSGEKCITCDTEYASNDIIPILPTSETDIARLTLRVKTLQEKSLTHSLKKASSKKRKVRHETALESNEDTSSPNGVNGKPHPSPNPTITDGDSDETERNTIKNSSTASLTAKVMQEQELLKKRKTESKNVQSLFSSKDQSALLGNSRDFMTRGFSVPAGSQR